MQRRYQVAAIAIVVGASLAFFPLSLSPGSLGEEEASSGPAITFTVGEELTYKDYGPNGETETLKVMTPRRILGANFSPQRAVPVVELSDDGSPQPGSNVNLESVKHGGLALTTQYCALKGDVTCSGDVLTSWQHCSYMTSEFTPFTTLTKPELENPPVVIEDPYRDINWTYSVEQVQDNRLRLTRQEGPQWRTCSPPSAGVIDMATGTLLRVEDGGTVTELTNRVRGSGNEVAVGSQDPARQRFVEPSVERSEPYPPGTGDLGPDRWPLAKAWSEALNRSQDLGSFMSDHPDAFIYNIQSSSSTTQDSTGTLEEGEWEWEFKVLATSADAVQVTSRKSASPAGTDYQASAESIEGPENAEPGLEPPLRQVPDYDAFQERLRTEDISTQSFWFTVFIDPASDHAIYQYIASIPVEAQETQDGGKTRGSTHRAIIMIETGRLLQVVSNETVAEHIANPDEYQ